MLMMNNNYINCLFKRRYIFKYYINTDINPITNFCNTDDDDNKSDALNIDNMVNISLKK